MIVKCLKSNHHVTVGEYLFEITNRIDNIYEFVQIWKGKKTVLHVGYEKDCIEAAEDFIKVTFNIAD